MEHQRDPVGRAPERAPAAGADEAPPRPRGARCGRTGSGGSRAGRHRGQPTRDAALPNTVLTALRYAVRRDGRRGCPCRAAGELPDDPGAPAHPRGPSRRGGTAARTAGTRARRRCSAAVGIMAGLLAAVGIALAAGAHPGLARARRHPRRLRDPLRSPGSLDDLYRLSPLAKLAAQGGAAALVLVSGVRVEIVEQHRRSRR